MRLILVSFSAKIINLEGEMAKRTIILVFIFLLVSSCAVFEKPEERPATLEARDFDYYFNQGLGSLKIRDYEKAIENFSAALSLNPRSFRAQNLCGLAYFYQKNYRPAEEKFREAVRLNPSFAEAYTNLGGVYFVTRRLNEAKEMLEKALSLSPDSVAAHYSLGSLLLLLGDMDGGAAHLTRAVELDPAYLDKNPPLLVDIPSAEANMAEIYFTYAKIFAQKGNVEKTLEYLTKAQQAGFSDWDRIKREKEFDPVREDPRLAAFIR
jgi:tetratricopeptide (TPR) repeat protein